MAEHTPEGGTSLRAIDRVDGLATKEEELSEAHDGWDVAVGIKETSLFPERWTSGGGRPVREEAGKGNVSRRASVSAKAQNSNRGKSLKIHFFPLRNCLSPGLLVPGARMGAPSPRSPLYLVGL